MSMPILETRNLVTYFCILVANEGATLNVLFEVLDLIFMRRLYWLDWLISDFHKKKYGFVSLHLKICLH